MTTRVSLGDSKIGQRPLSTVIIVVGLILAWIIFGGTPLLAIFSIASLLFFGFKNPALGMSVFLVTQFTIPSYMIGPISLRLIMLLIIGVIIWHANTREKIQLGKNAKYIIIPLTIIVGISVISDIFYTDFSFVFKDFRNIIGGLLIIIFIPATVKNIKDLKLLCSVAIFTVIVSSIIALMQHYNIFNFAQYLAIPGRAQGISESELQFSYIIGVVLLAFVGMLFLKGIFIGRIKIILSAFLMLAALYFTYTRSALYALLFGLVSLILLIKTRIKGEFILLAVLLITLFISMTGITDNFSFSGRNEISQEASGIARKILWQAGIAIALDYPVLGIGGNQYVKISPQYITAVDPSLIQWEADRYWSYRTLGNDQVHNDFLNMWVSYGTIALIVFTWLIFVILNNFLSSFKLSKDKFLKSVSIGLAAGLISYVVNAFYHNLLSEFPLLWIIAGLSIATSKLADMRKSEGEVKHVSRSN